MSKADHSVCPICKASFQADKTKEHLYHNALSHGNQTEIKHYLGVINAYWALKYHMEDKHAEKMFICGRQFEGRFDGKPEAFLWDDMTCSYCGSMSPDEFFKAVEAGVKITPTDKNYKVYVDNTKKFYFQHLNEAERDRFIELHNAKKMNLAYPGYFYAVPYFCTPKCGKD